MRVLITGNLGYVGSYLTDYLSLNPNFEQLIGLDAGWFESCLTDPQGVENSKLIQLHGDIRSLPDGCLRGIDAVIHLAAVSNDPIGKSFGPATTEINGDACGSVARLAKAAGVKRFIFASSCSLYGAAGDTERKEDDELNPLTAYAQGKARAEGILQSLAVPDFQVCSLRFATACGWTRRFRSDLVLNDFVLTGLKTGEIRVLSDGTPWRPLIHVSDMARAIEWAVMRQLDKHNSWCVLNVGHPHMNVRIGELATRVAARLSGVEVSINRNATPDKRSYSVNFSRLKAIAPSAYPRIQLDDAIEDLCINITRRMDGFDEGNWPQTVRLKTLESHVEAGILDENLRKVG